MLSLPIPALLEKLAEAAAKVRHRKVLNLVTDVQQRVIAEQAERIDQQGKYLKLQAEHDRLAAKNAEMIEEYSRLVAENKDLRCKLALQEWEPGPPNPFAVHHIDWSKA